MRILTTLAALLVLSGCASAPGLYGELGLGMQINGMSDQWLSTENDLKHHFFDKNGVPIIWNNQCSRNIVAHIAAGYEVTEETRVEYRHHSWLMCGAPFNDLPEMYSDEVMIIRRFGGR